MRSVDMQLLPPIQLTLSLILHLTSSLTQILHLTSSLTLTSTLTINRTLKPFRLAISQPIMESCMNRLATLTLIVTLYQRGTLAG